MKVTSVNCLLISYMLLLTLLTQVLQSLRQIPMVKRDQRLDAFAEKCVNEVVIVTAAILTDVIVEASR